MRIPVVGGRRREGGHHADGAEPTSRDRAGFSCRPSVVPDGCDA